MSFRSWRERKLLSQERIAEMSGLSLRTVQRLEAGHRVSYASLRALAAAFAIEVDVLEREFYAMKKSTDEFIEIPRWLRLMSDSRWFGGRGLSRRDALRIEVLCAACTAVAFAMVFLAKEEARPDLVYTGAVALASCYLTALRIRLFDKYKLWPGAENALSEQPRTWRTIAAEYAFLVGVGILGIVAAAWLLVR